MVYLGGDLTHLAPRFRSPVVDVGSYRRPAKGGAQTLGEPLEYVPFPTDGVGFIHGLVYVEANTHLAGLAGEVRGAVEVELLERTHGLVPDALARLGRRLAAQRDAADLHAAVILPEFSQKSAATSTATTAQIMNTGPTIPRRRLLCLPESKGFKLDEKRP